MYMQCTDKIIVKLHVATDGNKISLIEKLEQKSSEIIG